MAQLKLRPFKTAPCRVFQQPLKPSRRLLNKGLIGTTKVVP